MCVIFDNCDSLLASVDDITLKQKLGPLVKTSDIKVVFISSSHTEEIAAIFEKSLHF